MNRSSWKSPRSIVFVVEDVFFLYVSFWWYFRSLLSSLGSFPGHPEPELRAATQVHARVGQALRFLFVLQDTVSERPKCQRNNTRETDGDGTILVHYSSLVTLLVTTDPFTHTLTRVPGGGRFKSEHGAIVRSLRLRNGATHRHSSSKGRTAL